MKTRIKEALQLPSYTVLGLQRKRAKNLPVKYDFNFITPSGYELILSLSPFTNKEATPLRILSYTLEHTKDNKIFVKGVLTYL